MTKHQPGTSIVTDELQELLICDICAEPYDNGSRQARFLDCHHTFCSKCLVSLAGKGQDNPRTILCPNCRHSTHLSDDGVDGLQTNFYVEKIKLIPLTTGQTKTASSTGGCHKHNDQPKSFFCETCRTAICRDCTVLDHEKAAGHSIANFTDAVATQHHSLGQRLITGIRKKKTMQRAVRQIDSNMTKLEVCRDSVLKDLRSIIQSTHQQLMDGEKQVTDIILKQYEVQQSIFRDKQLQIQQTSKLLDKQINQSEALMKTGDIGEMIRINGKLGKTLEMVKLDTTELDSMKSYLASDMITGATSLNDSLCHLGNKIFHSVLPSNIVLENSKIIAGFESTVTIRLINHDGNVVATAACFLSINITDPWKSDLPVTLAKTDPECTVIFTPQRSGRHDIAVRYLGQELKGEQNHIIVESNNPVLKIGGPGNGSGTLKSPRGISIDHNGCLYVADTGNGLIQKFSSNGEFMSQFRVNAVNKSYSAFSVAVHLDKGLMICTEILTEDDAAVEGNTMLLFNPEGELQQTYTLDNMGCPLHITTNNGGNMLMSDEDKGCVFEVDTKGKALKRIGNNFGRPGFICVDDNDDMIVSDVTGSCIFMFHPDGKVKHQFGSHGKGRGKLHSPFGVATDGENILVAEGENNRVQVFRYDGTSVCVIESKEDPLEQPRGLAITDDGYVFVVDRGNHCVKKYKYRDVP